MARLQSYVWIIFGLVYIPIQLKTVASILQIVLPGFNTYLCMFIGVTIAVAYTAFAGMKGASIVGRVVCIATYVLLGWFIFTNIGDFGGYSGLIAQLPKGYDQLSAMSTQQIVAWMIGGILTSIVLQSALQPVLAAKSDKAATWGCVLGYVIAGPICILTAIIGMMARAKTDGLGDGATAFAWAIKDMSSPVMAGIIFAVMTMIIAATLATMMMATGTIVTNVYKKQINPKADEKKLLTMSRLGTVAVAYVSLLLGFFIPSAQMTNMFLTVNYVVTAPFSFSVLAGMFWKKANAKGSFWSIVAGIVVALIWVLAGLNESINVVVSHHHRLLHRGRYRVSYHQQADFFRTVSLVPTAHTRRAERRGTSLKFTIQGLPNQFTKKRSNGLCPIDPISAGWWTMPSPCLNPMSPVRRAR